MAITRLLYGVLILVACLIGSSANADYHPQTEQQIEVSRLSPGTRVIPLYFQHGDYWCTNLKTPAILIKNNLSTEVQIWEIAVTGLVDGKQTTSNTFNNDQVEQCIADSAKTLNNLLADPADPANYHALCRVYGVPVYLEDGYCASSVIPSGSYAAVILSRLALITFTGPAKLDSIEITVTTVDSGSHRTAPALLVPLEEFTCQGEYTFPIKGCSIVGSVPAGPSHRFGNAQEFALDILDLRRFADGSFSTSAVPNETVVMGSDNADDYYIYSREVLAIGDGVVIRAENGFPDELAMNPQDFFMPRIERLTPDLLAKGVSLANIKGGNFIVIDHGNGEYSRYCHLRADLRVEAGDKVSRGQVIALVGNSGNSMEPHLHLELLDSADIATANGLPLVFTDLQLSNALESPSFGEKNSLLFSEFIFTYTR